MLSSRSQQRYLGLVFGEPPRNVLMDDSSVLVRPEVAAKQLAQETGPQAEPDKNGGPAEDNGEEPIPLEPVPAPHRFYGTAKLSAARLSSSAGQIGDEIVQHLKALVDSEVEITIEIQASVPGGIPESVVRTISENARTLKFEKFEFEEE